MSYLAIARKWRPQHFDDVVGQAHITRTLQNAIRLGRIHHAFVFTGARGVGKTTCARIFSRALNCEKGPTPEPCGVCRACVEITSGASVDVVEIDGASNNGVDEVRSLRENVRYLPSKGQKKVYIIDEVHMLSTAAFNALLKTLEEPPSHVLFILATTEPQKIPDTILSRCLRFDFKRIPLRAIVDKLAEIVAAEGVEVSPISLALIAREAEGSMRDSQSLLDQVISFSGTQVSDEQVVEILGLIDRRLIYDLLEGILKGDGERCLALVDEVFSFGFDLKQLARDLLEAVRNLQVARVADGGRRLLDVSDDDFSRLKDLAAGTSIDVLNRLFTILMGEWETLSRSESPRYHLEMTLLRMTQVRPVQGLDQLLTRLATLELQLKEGRGMPVQSERRGPELPPRPMVTSSPPPARQEPPPSLPGEGSKPPGEGPKPPGGDNKGQAPNLPPAPPEVASSRWTKPSRPAAVEPAPRSVAPSAQPPSSPAARPTTTPPTPPSTTHTTSGSTTTVTPPPLAGVVRTLPPDFEPPPPGGRVGRPGEGKSFRDFVLSLDRTSPRFGVFRHGVALKEEAGSLEVGFSTTQPIRLQSAQRLAADDVTGSLLMQFFKGVMSLRVVPITPEDLALTGQMSIADEDLAEREDIRNRLTERARSHPLHLQALGLFDVGRDEVLYEFDEPGS